MSPFKLYGIIVGIVSILIGALLLFCKRIDSFFSDDPTEAKEIKQKRIVLGIVAILAGLLSLSAVLLGWPPIRGYIVPPP